MRSPDKHVLVELTGLDKEHYGDAAYRCFMTGRVRCRWWIWDRDQLAKVCREPEIQKRDGSQAGRGRLPDADRKTQPLCEPWD